MKSFKDVSKQLDEVLTKSTPAGEWIHDFVHSDNPKFKGKSAAKRKQMALAAYYAKKNEGASPSQNSNTEVDMNEDMYTSEYKIKHYVDPVTGENKTRKIRPHRVDFKNSKMRGEPAQKDSPGDYGMKEDVNESRGHKIIANYFRNKDIVKNIASQSPEEKAAHEKQHHDAMVKAHNEYVKKNPHSIFKPMKEEAEQIDELSKGTLVRYINRASQDVHNKALEAGKDSEKPGKASDFIKKYQKSGKRQTGITKAAVSLARKKTFEEVEKWHVYDTKTNKVHSTHDSKSKAEHAYNKLNKDHEGYDTPGGLIRSKYGMRKEEVQLEEDLDTAHIHQLLANKDINAQVKNGKVHVHSSDVKAAKMHLGAAGHKHEVVGGLNEDQEEDDRQGAEHHQHELERQEYEAKKKEQLKKYDWINKLAKNAPKQVKEEAEQIDEAGKVYDPLTKKMVARKPIKVQAGGGATRNGVPVETGPSKYKTIRQAYDAATAGQKVTPKQVKEEAEQIDEISQKTLKSYVNKAEKEEDKYQQNYSKLRSIRDKTHGKFSDDTPEMKHLDKKYVNRANGVDLAKQKLAKEEVEQIDELSKKTLASYATKAHHDAALKANDLGHQLGRSTDHTHIFSAGYQKQKGEYSKRAKGIDTAIKKLAKEENMDEAKEYKGIGTDVVDKKKVLNPPIPLTQKPKQVKDFKEGDEYDEKWKGYKGKSFKKESTMLKFGDFLEEAKKCMDETHCDDKKMEKEELVGNQHKLDKNKNGKLDADDFKKLRGEELVGKQHKIDKNHNGKIDADDFKKLRKEETESIEESYPTKQHFEQMAALIKSHDDMKKRSDLAHHHAGIFKGQNPRFDHKKFMHACGVHESAVCEEVEQIDELSKDTLASYIPKAAKSARIHGQISTEYKKSAETKRKPGLKNALDNLSKKYRAKAWSREDGIKRATDKLAKEEVEQIDELSKKTLGSYAQAATMDAAKKGNEVAKLGNNLAALAHPLSPLHKLNKRLAGHAKAIGKLTKEEAEQIDELSKKTLGNYVKGAAKDMTDREVRVSHGMKPYPGESDADYRKDMQKAKSLQDKRKAGMDKAIDKLTKEEVSQEMSPYVKGTLAVMDEGKIDDLRDAQALRKAGASSYDKELKPDTKHPHIKVVKGSSYGGENQKDDDNDEKSDNGEKRGRGRPSGSKSGAR